MWRGTCGPFSRGMIICSISKLTIAAGSSPSYITGVFIRNVCAVLDAGDPPQMRHAAGMHEFVDPDPSMTRSGVQPCLYHPSPLSNLVRQRIRQSQPRMRVRDAFHIIGRPMIGQCPGSRLVYGKRCGRIAIARLPGRAENGEPLALRQKRHRHVLHRGMGNHLARRGQAITAGTWTWPQNVTVAGQPDKAVAGRLAIGHIMPGRRIGSFGVHEQQIVRTGPPMAARARNAFACRSTHARPGDGLAAVAFMSFAGFSTA